MIVRGSFRGTTHTICNALHGWLREQKNKQQSNAPNPKKQCSYRLSGSNENRAFEGCRLLHSDQHGHLDLFNNKCLKSLYNYSQLSPCGHLAITDTPKIQTAAKSPANLNYSRLTEINFCYYGLSLLTTLTRSPKGICNKES